ncbi:MAG: hypothetical protein IKI97_02700 [Clostridia bacterium]|nr:hypothetical protein [Clostridia bacterium]
MSAVAEAAKEKKSDEDDEPDAVIGKGVCKAVTHSSFLRVLLSAFRTLCYIICSAKNMCQRLSYFAGK